MKTLTIDISNKESHCINVKMRIVQIHRNLDWMDLNEFERYRAKKQQKSKSKLSFEWCECENKAQIWLIYLKKSNESETKWERNGLSSSSMHGLLIGKSFWWQKISYKSINGFVFRKYNLWSENQ